MDEDLNMKQKFNLFFSAIFLIFLVPTVKAHCPLCTIGAGAAAAGAVWLGVSKVVVALLIGGFSMSMGLWFSRVIKKKYIPLQGPIITIVVFLTTVLPLMPIFKVIGPLYLSFIGEYGTTFAVNYSLATSILGGIIVFSSPKISKKLTNLRKGKMLPFQGVILTISLLIITGGIIQLII